MDAKSATPDTVFDSTPMRLDQKARSSQLESGKLSVLTQVDSLFVCKLMPMTCIVPDLIVVVPQVMAKFAYAYSVCRTPVSFVTSLM